MGRVTLVVTRVCYLPSSLLIGVGKGSLFTRVITRICQLLARRRVGFMVKGFGGVPCRVGSGGACLEATLCGDIFRFRTSATGFIKVLGKKTG